AAPPGLRRRTTPSTTTHTITPREESIVQLPPIATTSVGSFPRPTWLADRQRTGVAFRLSGTTLDEALDDATVITLREQEEVGLDLLTDGEQRRVHFIEHVLEGMDGFDLVHLGEKAIRRNKPNDILVPRVVGPIRHRASTAAADVARARPHTARPLKMA